VEAFIARAMGDGLHDRTMGDGRGARATQDGPGRTALTADAGRAEITTTVMGVIMVGVITGITTAASALASRWADGRTTMTTITARMCPNTRARLVRPMPPWSIVSGTSNHTISPPARTWDTTANDIPVHNCDTTAQQRGSPSPTESRAAFEA
jgi:hypothetical protein